MDFYLRYVLYDDENGRFDGVIKIKNETRYHTFAPVLDAQTLSPMSQTIEKDHRRLLVKFHKYTQLRFGIQVKQDTFIRLFNLKNQPFFSKGL